MDLTKFVEKVVAYITKGTSMFVFRHVHSNAGIQVPAGTLELDETTEDGVLREAKEETGLSILRFVVSWVLVNTTCHPLDLPRFTGVISTISNAKKKHHPNGAILNCIQAKGPPNR